MTGKARERGRLVLPTLILAVSSIDPPSLIINISLIEIALFFGVSVSLAGQIQSITSTLGIIAALVMGAMSVRYNYKALLTAGLLINLVSAVFCNFAPSFGLLVASFSAMGLVSSLVTPMVFAYIGEYYSEERRSKTIGTLASLRTVVYLVMVQLIGYVVGHWGWRNAFLFLVVPVTCLGLASSLRALPDVKRAAGAAQTSILDGYRSVMNSGSALACLLGNSLASASWIGVVMYSVSYLRERFLLSRSDASLIFSGLVIGVLVGNYAGGLLVARYGRKRLAVLSSLLTGVLIVGYMNAPSVLFTLAVVPLMSVMGGIVLTSANSLVLEQVPGYRGTIMSANSAASQLGTALGAAVGGLALYIYNWGVVGLSLGAIQVIASLVYRLGARESGQLTRAEVSRPEVADGC